MRAAVLHAPYDLRIEERPAPVFGAEDLLIEVTHNGLCGTDATEYSKGPMMVPLNDRHPGSGHKGPTILGHEFIGTVVDAGAHVRDRLGSRVACGAGVSCGNCSWCQSGRTNLCAGYYTLGLSTHGGMAELAAAPSSICVDIPAECADTDAALAQPLAVGIHAASRAGVRPGDDIILLGAGAIGSFVLAALDGHQGSVVAVDVDAARLDVARMLGATHTVHVSRDATATDVREAIADISPDGAGVVFEASGAPGGAERAYALAARGGTVVLVGLNKTPQPLSLADVVLREVNTATTVAHVCATDLPAALNLLSRRPLGEMLVEGVIGLDDVVVRGMQPLVEGSATGKILVDPRRG